MKTTQYRVKSPRLLNGFEQFILMSSKEQEQDGKLESIELINQDNEFNSYFFVGIFF
jgi:hypothetical protein